MNRRVVTSLLVAGTVAQLLFAGCAGTNATTTDPATPPKSAEDPARALRPGMLPAQIETIMGKPTEEFQVPGQGTVIVVWLYRRSIGARVDQVAPTMTETPWIDPITGELKILTEPEASEQRTEFIEELSLYLAGGQLAEIRRTVKRERAFTR